MGMMGIYQYPSGLEWIGKIRHPTSTSILIMKEDAICFFQLRIIRTSESSR